MGLIPTKDSVEISLPFRLIPEKDYPVQCCECFVTLRDAAEGAAHEAHTDHSDGVYLIDRKEADEANQLMRAVGAWESARCPVCGAQFFTEREASEHLKLSGHSIVVTSGRKLVN